MTDPDALLAAILADPDEDTIRLAYADAIEDADPERAEFIRVQVELERLRPLTRDDPACYCEFLGVGEPACSVCQGHEDTVAAIASRERELLSANGREWFNEVIPDAQPSNWSPHNPTPYLILPGPSFVNVEFRRGFAESVTCTGDAWADHADAITARHPVTRVTLTAGPTLEGDGSDGVMSARIRGRDVWLDFPEVFDPHAAVLALLKAEWPRIQFGPVAPAVRLNLAAPAPTVTVTHGEVTIGPPG